MFIDNIGINNRANMLRLESSPSNRVNSRPPSTRTLAFLFDSNVTARRWLSLIRRLSLSSRPAGSGLFVFLQIYSKLQEILNKRRYKRRVLGGDANKN